MTDVRRGRLVDFWGTAKAPTSNGSEFDKVEESKPAWKHRFQMLSDKHNMEITMTVSVGKWNGHRVVLDFIRSEFKQMGEGIMELLNNQTNRAFCDDVMQVMRERGAIK